MSPVIAIIDRTEKADFAHMQTVAISITKQVQNDLSRAWGVSGQVVALNDPSLLATGMWPIYLVDTLPPAEGGVHYDDAGQVYALVEYGDAWELAASHEACEMLVDCSGNRLQAAGAISLDEGGNLVDAPGTFQYVVEVCDPCETHSYPIESVAVSDFYLPSFFDAVPTPGRAYSQTGALTRPRTVLPGGYISWLNPATGTIQQLNWTGAAPVIRDLGPTAQVTGRPLRSFIDAVTRPAHSLSTFADHDARRRWLEARAAHRQDTEAHSARWDRTLNTLYQRAEALAPVKH